MVYIKDIDRKNTQIEMTTEQIEKEIEIIADQIEFAKNNLPEWEKQLEDLKKEYEDRNWMNTGHDKEFDGLVISANYDTWTQTKKNYKNDNGIGVFCYEDRDRITDDGLTVEDAKELIEYLQQKIDYLEEK